MSYGKIGLKTMAVTHDLLSGMTLVLLKKKIIRLSNSILPEPGQPSAQLSKLIRLTACKKTKHTVSRWYRTVYIRWLVASYDTHKGKRWLNSDPPSHRGQFHTTKNYLNLKYFCIRTYIRLMNYCGFFNPQLTTFA